MTFSIQIAAHHNILLCIVGSLHSLKKYMHLFGMWGSTFEFLVYPNTSNAFNRLVLLHRKSANPALKRISTFCWKLLLSLWVICIAKILANFIAESYLLQKFQFTWFTLSSFLSQSIYLLWSPDWFDQCCNKRRNQSSWAVTSICRWLL